MAAVHHLGQLGNAQGGRQPMQVAALSLEVWGATDRGREREGNEDYVYPHSGADTFAWQPSPERLRQKGRLLVVADGVGGAHAGREASSSATRVVVEHYYELAGPDPADNLRAAIEQANSSVFQQIATRASLQGAGTTVTAAVVLNDMLHVASVGDSRAYLIRDGQIARLTRDHTLTQQRVDQGLIAPEQADLDPGRNVLTRSLGAGPTVQVDVFPPLRLAPGDIVLLCSDGLTDMLEDTEIARVVGDSPPKRAARRLIAAANSRGGFDNIAVVVGRVGGKRPAVAGALPGGLRGAVNDMRGMTRRERTILLAGAILVATALCAMAALGWEVYERAHRTPSPTATPTAPVEAPTTEAVPGGGQITPAVSPGHATSTPAPSSTPTSTPRPSPTPTHTPTATPTLEPTPTPAGGGGLPPASPAPTNPTAPSPRGSRSSP